MPPFLETKSHTFTFANPSQALCFHKTRVLTSSSRAIGCKTAVISSDNDLIHTQNRANEAFEFRRLDLEGTNKT